MIRHVAVVTTSYPQTPDDPSGHFVRTEVNALLRRGDRVTVICPGTSAFAPDRGQSPDCSSGGALEVLRLGASATFGWPGALPRLRKQPWLAAHVPGFVRRARSSLSQLKCDQVIAHWLLGSGWPIALASPVPAEVVVHGSDARLLRKLPSPARALVLGQLEAHGCTLRLVAPHLAPLLRTRSNAAWIDTARIEALPLEVPELPSKLTLRQQLGIGSGEFLAVIASRLVESKRVDVALRRAPVPRSCRIVVLGSGPMRARLQRDFPHVEFLGQRPHRETLSWLKASDVVMSASVEEGAPTALREARSLGVPVWTAEYGSAQHWSRTDPDVRVLAEFALSPSTTRPASASA